MLRKSIRCSHNSIVFLCIPLLYKLYIHPCRRRRRRKELEKGEEISLLVRNRFFPYTKIVLLLCIYRYGRDI